MLIFLQSIPCDALLLFLLISIVSIRITKATSTLPFTNNDNHNRIKQADEYVMTSKIIDGLKRSNVCGDGYRIEGALLKSYPYMKNQSYLPYEDCYMTFKARRPDYQIHIRILLLDLNDIQGGVNCLDSLRFYKSAYIIRQDKIGTTECGQVKEEQQFFATSSTGIVTAHFSSDGGNVNGLGFKVVLTAFRQPNKTHPCDLSNEEFSCNHQECISSTLLCDGVPHCLDGSDEMPHYACSSSTAEASTGGKSGSNSRATTPKRPQWRGVLIAAFLLIILAVFLLFTLYFISCRCVRSPVPLMKTERKNYATIINSPKNGLKSTTTTTRVVIGNDKPIGKHLDDDYNLL